MMKNIATVLFMAAAVQLNADGGALDRCYGRLYSSSNTNLEQAGDVFSTTAICYASGEVSELTPEPYATLDRESPWTCSIECDGGSVYLTEISEDRLVLKSVYLRIDVGQFFMIAKSVAQVYPW